jgi:hypothetical protein
MYMRVPAMTPFSLDIWFDKEDEQALLSALVAIVVIWATAFVLTVVS